MGGEWREYTFATLIQAQALEIGDGYRAKNSELGGDGPFFLRAGHVRDTHIDFDGADRFHRELTGAVTSKMSCPGDVIVTTKGNSTGRTSFVSDNLPPFVYSPHLSYWRSLDAKVIVPGFLRYWSRSQHFQAQLAGLAASTDMAPYLSLVDQKRLRVILPPVGEQRAIAHILGTLDNKIELNRRMNETLEAMARALFKSWLVDFDPVRAKAEGRDPGLPKEIADLFPDSFEDSELGEVPRGWQVKRVEDLAERVGMGPFGSSIKVETFVAEGVPVISGQHLHGFMLEDRTYNFITIKHADRLKSAIVERGDVVFTHAGNIGQVAYIPDTSQYERYVISLRQFFMRCDRSQVSPSFMALYFRSPEGQHRLLANASSSGVPSIARPVTYLRSIPVTIPPKPVMDEFDKLVQPMLFQFRGRQNESRALAALRDTLLPKLLSGEVRVKEAERVSEASS